MLGNWKRANILKQFRAINTRKKKLNLSQTKNRQSNCHHIVPITKNVKIIAFIHWCAFACTPPFAYTLSRKNSFNVCNLRIRSNVQYLHDSILTCKTWCFVSILPHCAHKPSVHTSYHDPFTGMIREDHELVILWRTIDLLCKQYFPLWVFPPIREHMPSAPYHGTILVLYRRDHGPYSMVDTTTTTLPPIFWKKSCAAAAPLAGSMSMNHESLSPAWHPHDIRSDTCTFYLSSSSIRCGLVRCWQHDIMSHEQLACRVCVSHGWWWRVVLAGQTGGRGEDDEERKKRERRSLHSCLVEWHAREQLRCTRRVCAQGRRNGAYGREEHEHRTSMGICLARVLHRQLVLLASKEML